MIYSELKCTVKQWNTKYTTSFIRVWYASLSQHVSNKVFIVDHFPFWDLDSRSTDQHIPNTDAAWRSLQCSREPISEPNLSQLNPVHIIQMCYLRSSWYPVVYSHISQTIVFFTFTAHANVPPVSFASIYFSLLVSVTGRDGKSWSQTIILTVIAFVCRRWITTAQQSGIVYIRRNQVHIVLLPSGAAIKINCS
jgi:hypothetical protein